MRKEKFIRSETVDPKTMTSASKMEYLLRVFDLAKDGEKAKERKEKFLDLLEQYRASKVEARVKSLNQISDSDAYTAKLHNQIMEILANMSLSRGLTENQRKVVEYLTADRKRVTRMVDDYFSGYETTNSRPMSQVQQARRGIGPFTSIGSDDED